MAKIILSETGSKEFAILIKKLSEEDKISLRYWISFVEKNGILKAQSSSDFKDHELTGEWIGYRAASFGYSSRVIYRVIDEIIEIVEIKRITTTHNYKRKV